MNNLGFPINVKQIGRIDDKMKIYIEDNVHSYINKLSRVKSDKTTLGALVGRCILMDGQKILFITGAIDVKHTEIVDGLLVFSKRSEEYIESQRNQYFNGYEIVGWILNQPTFGNFLSDSYEQYHLNNFPEEYHTLLVTDYTEKQQSFYVQNNDGTALLESSGFFVYYDKNENMFKYLEQDKIQGFVDEQPTQKIYKPRQQPKQYEEDIPIQQPQRQSTKRTTSTRPTRPHIREYKEQPKSLLSNLQLANASTIVGMFMIIGLLLIRGQITTKNDVAQLQQQVNSVVGGYSGVVPANGGNNSIEETPSTQVPDTYVIEENDTLLSIAMYFYGDESAVSTIMEYNGLTSENQIQQGMVIRLP